MFVLISINLRIARVNLCAAGFKKAVKNGQNEEAPVVVFFLFLWDHVLAYGKPPLGYVV